MSTTIESETIESETIKSVVIDLIKDGKEMITTHAPAAIQDILTWAIIQPFLVFAMLAIAMLVFFFSYKKVDKINKDRGYYENQELPFICVCFISGSAVFVLTIILCVEIGNAAHAYFAPYSYLIKMFT